MFKEVYNHQLAISYDLMFEDALINANPYFHFLDKIKEAEEYANITDLIFEKILNSKNSVLIKIELEEIQRHFT